jgi:hypothetical protein
VRTGSKYFGFTAGHVIQEASDHGLWASLAAGTKLQRLPFIQTWFTTPVDQGGTRLDVGIIPLRSDAISEFAGRVFLSNEDMSMGPDGRDDLAEFYYLFGFPASRRQARIAHHERHIRQRSFQFTTSVAAFSMHQKENLPVEDHVLLEFDHRNIRAGGETVNPPKLQGVSGGAICRVARNTEQPHLVAIATEHRKAARMVVGTRIERFMEIASAL